MHEQSGIFSNSVFSLLDLPAEIRFMVYGYVLRAKGGYLRARFFPFTRKPTGKICDISILSTSKLIYKEARQLLYTTNNFHFHFETGGDPPRYHLCANTCHKHIAMRSQLHLLKYISISHNALTSGHDWVSPVPIEDLNIARFIVELTDRCRHLQTLDIFLYPAPTTPWQQQRYALGFEGFAPLTARALKYLLRRHAAVVIKIAGIGKQEGMFDDFANSLDVTRRTIKETLFQRQNVNEIVDLTLANPWRLHRHYRKIWVELGIQHILTIQRDSRTM